MPAVRGRGVDHRLAVGFLADVALDEDAVDLVGHLLPELGLQVRDDDLAALCGEHARRALAQPGGPAGDDEDLACDVHGVLLDGGWVPFLSGESIRPWTALALSPAACTDRPGSRASARRRRSSGRRR